MNTPSFNDSFLKWDAAQVSTYINMATTKDSERQYGSLFLDNNIDGSLLPFLSTEHLKELGIITLKIRLLIKKSISDLIVDHYRKYTPQSIYDPEYALNNINIDGSQISLESLKVSAVLIQDSIRKFNRETRGQQVDSPLSPTQHEIKRLNDNFKKLKTDLIPVIRLLKDSKPLPTPTLDPGPAATLDSPTFSPSHSIDDKGKAETTRTDSGHNNDPDRPSTGDAFSPVSKRFSSGSLLSMGTGQIISQLVSKVVDDKSHEFKLQKVGSQRHKPGFPGSSASSNLRPRLVENTSSGSTVTVNTDQQRAQSQQGAALSGQLRSPLSQMQMFSGQQIQQQQPHQPPSSIPQQHQPRLHAGNEPLKQLRASTDDSCLKILQHAMKRHHIPREDWSKYVLVICYGDKERILKLAEKPVVVYKELQELGKHPAIMLRQLADVSSSEPEDYEDSRISSDIPGGVL